MNKVEKIVRWEFFGIAEVDVEDISSEARLIQLARYGNMLDDQARCHCEKIAHEAARNIGYTSKTVNIGRYKSQKANREQSDRVTISCSSLNAMMDDHGFDVEFEEQLRPEFRLQPILDLLPDGHVKSVCNMLLNEEITSIEAAAEKLSVDARSIFSALGHIGKIMQRADQIPDNSLFCAATTDGVRRAVIRICQTTVCEKRVSKTKWDQPMLLTA